MAFSFRQIQYFVAVAENGAVSRAAHQLATSQSTVTEVGRCETIGNAHINHPKVAMISATGDVATGKTVLQAASKTVKRTRHR